jgi:cis-3-alkyl-4-acyloxetan-2-one decarboxylase
MFDTIFHRLLRIPYTLNVRYIQKPKKSKATLLFIHGIGNSGDAWQEIIHKMPQDIEIISIDLLGFGESPKPSWSVYNAKAQANAVLATLLKIRTSRRKLIVVGHSLGALVAVEMAKRYPLLIRSLILCSPPFYNAAASKSRLLPSSEKTLRRLYTLALKNPEQFLQLSAFAMKYNLINRSFNVTSDNIESYMAALESMIINQSSFRDAFSLKVPTTIIRGTLDPFIVAKNIRAITTANPNVISKKIIAGHEIRGRYINPVVTNILNELNTPK